MKNYSKVHGFEWKILYFYCTEGSGGLPKKDISIRRKYGRTQGCVRGVRGAGRQAARGLAGLPPSVGRRPLDGEAVSLFLMMLIDRVDIPKAARVDCGAKREYLSDSDELQCFI